MQSRLPAWLQMEIEARIQGVPGKALQASYAGMSEAYRQGGQTKPGGDSRFFWLAYLCARMPATFAAVEAALLSLPAELLASCESLLDLGSGPGTASWAACSVHPGLKRAFGMERDAAAVELAGELAKAAPLKAQFSRAELPQGLAEAPKADLVILAYSLGEMGPAALVLAASKAQKLFLVVEPGTPAGFKSVLGAREALPGLIAPCAQAGACPLAASAEARWCHFSARLERQRMAKLLKGGDLGYEDEKFSYAAFSRLEGAKPMGPRILGRPRALGREIKLELCGADGLAEIKVPKSDKALHKLARKAAWGETWP